jgi:yecA family protein
MSKAVSYEKLESTLHKLGAQLGAAETHGLLTGMLTLTKPSKNEAWRPALLENLDCTVPTKAQWGVFSSTSAQILAEFSAKTFAFNLLLPNDNSPLSARLDALGFWCRGYLSGLGLAGVSQGEMENAVVQELVQDLSQIAHISVETEASEEDEHNYMELVEYVRAAVQNIQLELQGDVESKIVH